MSSSKRSKNKSFVVTSVVSLIGATALMVAVQPSLADYARHRAVAVADLSTANTIDPVFGYHAAMLLDRGNDSYRNELAERYISAWEPQKALDLLDEPHHASNASHEALLRSRALMELNRGVESSGLQDGGEESHMQAILVKATYANNPSFELSDASDGMRKLARRVQFGGVALAQELINHGMPQSALRVLEPAAPSVEREILISQIELDRRDHENDALKRAREAVDTGLGLEPSSISLHELSQAIYRRIDDIDSANREAQTIQSLQNGTF